MTGILGLQEAMFPGAAGGWGQWAAGVVFEDWHGLRDRVACGVPGGRRIVAAVDAIAGACANSSNWSAMRPTSHVTTYTDH